MGQAVASGSSGRGAQGPPEAGAVGVGGRGSDRHWSPGVTALPGKGAVPPDSKSVKTGTLQEQGLGMEVDGDPPPQTPSPGKNREPTVCCWFEGPTRRAVFWGFFLQV